MSDEYASSGFQGSLVNESVSHRTQAGTGSSDYITNNYPASGDSTSSGGYGSDQNVWSDQAQRGRPKDTGLVDQSLSGGSLAQEVRSGDAAQGEDVVSRRAVSGETMNPYGSDSWEGRKEAEDNLASKYADARGRMYESGPAASEHGDRAAAFT